MGRSFNGEPQATVFLNSLKPGAFGFALNEKTIHRTRPAMGTLFEVLLLGEDEQHLAAVADAVLDEIERVERLLSRFDPRSEIYRINRLASRQCVQVDREVADVLATCFDAQRWTGGAFDITVASGRGQPPDGADSQRVANIPGITFDFQQRQIRFDTPNIRLDLGAFGKGYALDRAAEILAEHGIENALLHGGTSSVLARGLDERGQPWRIALRDSNGTKLSEFIDLRDESLSCSGFDESGDVVDPRTASRLVGRSTCAVVAPTASEAEILSTALLIDSSPKSWQAVAPTVRSGSSNAGIRFWRSAGPAQVAGGKFSNVGPPGLVDVISR